MPTNPTTPELLSEEALARIERESYAASLHDVRALCQTVRALREELECACEFCDESVYDKQGNPLTFLVCGRCWNKREQEVAALRDQLAQAQAENQRLASQLKEWQEEKDTKAGYL